MKISECSKCGHELYHIHMLRADGTRKCIVNGCDCVLSYDELFK